MTQHDFTDLYSKYPDVIKAMSGDSFTSHQFILCLARAHQKEYVEALYAYRNSMHESKPAPFKVVHARLAQQLREYPSLIKYVGTEAHSEDIFGQSNGCARWVKVKV